LLIVAYIFCWKPPAHEVDAFSPKGELIVAYIFCWKPPAYETDDFSPKGAT